MEMGTWLGLACGDDGGGGSLFEDEDDDDDPCHCFRGTPTNRSMECAMISLCFICNTDG